MNGFDKCHNLSKRNVKLILKILSDLEPLKGSSNKKTSYSTCSCVNRVLYDARGPLKHPFHSRFKLTHSCHKEPNLYTNSLNNILFSHTYLSKKQKLYNRWLKDGHEGRQNHYFINPSKKKH
jgi:hypothetical protein